MNTLTCVVIVACAVCAVGVTGTEVRRSVVEPQFEDGELDGYVDALKDIRAGTDEMFIETKRRTSVQSETRVTAMVLKAGIAQALGETRAHHRHMGVAKFFKALFNCNKCIKSSGATGEGLKGTILGNTKEEHEEKVKKVLAEADADKDGTVTPKEFVKAMRSAHVAEEDTTDEQLLKTFKQASKDASGSVAVENAVNVVMNDHDDQTLRAADMKIEKAYALEWLLLPVPNPFPNPMITFICNPLLPVWDKSESGNMAWEKDKIVKASKEEGENVEKKGAVATTFWNKVRTFVSKLFAKTVKLFKAVMSFVFQVIRCAVCVVCDLIDTVVQMVKMLGTKLKAMGGAIKAKLGKWGKAIKDKFSKAKDWVKDKLSRKKVDPESQEGKAKQCKKHNGRSLMKSGAAKDCKACEKLGFCTARVDGRRCHCELTDGGEEASLIELSEQQKLALYVHLMESGQLSREQIEEQILSEHVFTSLATSLASFIEAQHHRATTANVAEAKSIVKLPNNCIKDENLGKSFSFAINVEGPSVAQWFLTGGLAGSLVPELLAAVVPVVAGNQITDTQCLQAKAAREGDSESDADALAKESVQKFENEYNSGNAENDEF